MATSSYSFHRRILEAPCLWITVFVFCCGISSVIAQEHYPSFTQEPESATVKAHSKVVLRCQATPDGATIQWLFNGEPILSGESPGVRIQNGRLVIKSFRKTETGSVGHDGIYQCVARNDYGGVMSRQAKLDVADLGEFYHGFTDMYINVTEGNVAFIPCAPPGGRPKPVTTFELNGTRIDLNDDHYAVLPSGNLQISNVRPKDNGIYRCIAENPINGEIRKATNVIHLTVIPPISNRQPVFHWVPPSEVKVTRGDDLTLECVVEGAPVPVVTWSKYGGKLPEKRSRLHFGNLVIRDVGKLDEGTYICRAENNINTPQVAIAQVDVLEPPVISNAPSDQIATEGSPVSFECQGRGQPTVTTQWYHNGDIVKGGDGLISISETELTITQVSRRHRGLYQCVAQSIMGSTSAVALLTVLKPGQELPDTHGAPDWKDEEMQGIAPDLNGNQPRATPGESEDNKQNSTPGGTMRVTSNPTMHQEGRNHGNTRSDDGTDVIEISDEAETSRNPGRKNKKNSRRNRQEEEEEAADHGQEMVPPSKPKVTRLSDTSVMLEWSVPTNEGLLITFYKVQYKELVRDRTRRRWRTIDEDIPSHVYRFEVSGLKPGSTYRFRIVGVYSNNDNLHGPNSKKFTMETAETVRPKEPLSGPVIVEARPLSETIIKLTWQYLPDEWSPIEGFHIYYRPYNSQDDHQVATVVGSHARETELTGLLSNTQYSIRMKGYNMAGESDYSNTVVKHTPSPSGGGFQDYNWGDDLYPGEKPGQQPNQPDAGDTASTPPGDKEYGPSMSTESSSRLLYIALGSVLGVMVLFLLVLMAMCARKQKQRARMLAAIEGRNKFHDPSRTIYTQDSMRRKQQANGNGFLLNGINGTHGNVSNGHLPMYTYPRMNVTANPMTEDGHGSLPYHHGNGNPPIDNIHSLQELRDSLQEILQQPPPPPPVPCCSEGGSNCNSTRDSQQIDSDIDNANRYDPNMSSFVKNSHSGHPHHHRRHHAPQPPVKEPHLYDHPPEYSSLNSRRSNDQNSCHYHNSLRSCNSCEPSSYRVHDPHLTDYIPRSHERLPYRRGGATEPDRMSENSYSSSSQVSAKHKKRRRKPMASPDYVVRDQSTNTDKENNLHIEEHNRQSNIRGSDSENYGSHPHGNIRGSDSDNYASHAHGNVRGSDSDNYGSHPHGNVRGSDSDNYASHPHGNVRDSDSDNYASHPHGNVRDSDSDNYASHPHGNVRGSDSDNYASHMHDDIEDSVVDSRDYEVLDQTYDPTDFVTSTPASHNANEDLSDRESLPEEPPSHPQLTQLPRVHDYPQTDPEDDL